MLQLIERIPLRSFKSTWATFICTSYFLLVCAGDSNTNCHLETSDFAMCVQNTFFPASYDVAEFSDIFALHYICGNTSIPPMKKNPRILSTVGKFCFPSPIFHFVLYMKELLRLLEETTRIGRGMISGFIGSIILKSLYN